jgi:hypothetical protein
VRESLSFSKKMENHVGEPFGILSMTTMHSKAKDYAAITTTESPPIPYNPVYCITRTEEPNIPEGAGEAGGDLSLNSILTDQ